MLELQYLLAGSGDFLGPPLIVSKESTSLGASLTQVYARRSVPKPIQYLCHMTFDEEIPLPNEARPNSRHFYSLFLLAN